MAIKIEPMWQVVVCIYGSIHSLTYKSSEEAQQTYKLISEAVKDSQNYKNDRKPVTEAVDIFGTSSFVTDEIKSVKIINLNAILNFEYNLSEAKRAAF